MRMIVAFFYFICNNNFFKIEFDNENDFNQCPFTAKGDDDNSNDENDRGSLSHLSLSQARTQLLRDCHQLYGYIEFPY